MNDSQCTSRLLASALHDMRNVLAVIRESNGLAQDMVELGKDGQSKSDRLKTALAETRTQVLKGAVLTDSMDYLAQALDAEKTGETGPCDLSRVAQAFCSMASRHARAARIALSCAGSDVPVWAQVSPLTAMRLLLEVFDLAASVGGEVTLAFRAGRQQRAEGVIIEVADGANTDLVLSALTGSPLLSEIKPGWRAMLLPWQDAHSRFFLSFAIEAEDHL